MNKKQLEAQNEQLNAKLNETRQELRDLQIRLDEAEAAQENQLAEAERLAALCADLKTENARLNGQLAACAAQLAALQAAPQPTAEAPAAETVTHEGTVPANKPPKDAAELAMPAQAVPGPEAEVPENGETFESVKPLTGPDEPEQGEELPQARIPAFSDEGADFEHYFYAAEPGSSAKPEQPGGAPVLPVEPDLPKNSAFVTEPAEPDETSGKTSQSDLSQTEANQTELSLAKSEAPQPEAAAQRTAAEQQELQNYCARLIGRVALAAARVMVSSPEQGAANAKDLALERSESFKRQATAFLMQPGSKSSLQQRLNRLTENAEQFLNALANGLPVEAEPAPGFEEAPPAI